MSFRPKRIECWILVIVMLAAILWAGSGCDQTHSSVKTPGPDPGVSDDSLRIGASLALSGHAGYLGTQTLHGAKAYLDYVNEAGGVHGRRLELIAYDDGYDPPRCMLNTQKLVVEDKIFSLFCYVGTPTTVKILPLVEEARVPLVGMFTGAHALRKPLNHYLVNIRASYYQETMAAVKHMVEKLGLRRIAVFYQYDAYGFDGLRGTELALKKYGLAPVATGTYIRGTLNIEKGLERIMNSGAQAVMMIGTYEPCAKFIRQARARGFEATFYNVSFVGADELARLTAEAGNGVMVTQVVPPPKAERGDVRLWGIRQYTALLKRYFPLDKPNFVSLEGYLNARVLVEGLKRAGRHLTREGFLRALETIRDYDLGIDNNLSFSATDHQGLERVYITRIENGRSVLIQ